MTVPIEDSFKHAVRIKCLAYSSYVAIKTKNASQLVASTLM